MKHVLLAIMATIAAPPALAQGNCAPFAAIRDGLAETWSESVSVTGLASEGSALVIFASPETGTWTAVIVAPDGTGCVVASGSAFEVAWADPDPDA